jgi:alcohol dehydrogenase class IV
VRDGDDKIARRAMAFASLCGGLALANAGLGAVHGFAGPFGGMYHAPHGAVCAALLPAVCATNVQALRKREPDHPALARYGELAAILTGSPDATNEEMIAWLRSLVDAFAIPPLSRYGFELDDTEMVVAKARVASSMKANPITLTEVELAGILSAAAA